MRTKHKSQINEIKTKTLNSGDKKPILYEESVLFESRTKVVATVRVCNLNEGHRRHERVRIRIAVVAREGTSFVDLCL